jgi:hypothetical protein
MAVSSRGGQLAASSIDPHTGERFIRIIGFMHEGEVTIEKIDSHKMQDISLSISRAGGTLLFVLKPWAYDKLVEAMERGVNE